jgi:hypothetical protein
MPPRHRAAPVARCKPARFTRNTRQPRRSETPDRAALTRRMSSGPKGRYMDPSPKQGLLGRGDPRYDCGRISGLSGRRYRVSGPDGICALSPHRLRGPEGLYPFQVLKERVVPVVPSRCISPCSYGQESPLTQLDLRRTSLCRTLILFLRRHQGPEDPGILIRQRR